MNISFSNSPTNYHLNKINKTNTPSFKGANNPNEDKKEPDQILSCSVDMRYLLNNPLVLLKTQLVKDGFTPKDMEQWEIANIKTVKSNMDLDFLVEHIDELEGKITGKDLFNSTPKSSKDINAMIRVYKALKEKLVTDDVIKLNRETYELEQDMHERFHIGNPDKNSGIKRLMLEILTNTTAENEIVTYTLLDDENFNNVNLPAALSNRMTQKDATRAISVIKMAQETGYDKEFSFALALMISDSTEANMPVIKKMISNDKEFLSENHKFVAERLLGFLRFCSDLPFAYLANEDVTLADINEIMQQMDSEENFED